MEIAIWIIAIVQVLRFIEEVDWEWWKNHGEKTSERNVKKGDSNYEKDNTL